MNTTPEQIAVVDYLKESLTALFPDNGIIVRAQEFLGISYIRCRYTHFKDASQCSSNIIENDPAFMGFSTNKERNGTFTIEHPHYHFNRLIGRDRPLKFRKLRGNTEMEVVQKLVAWFTKNRELIGTANTAPGY